VLDDDRFLIFTENLAEGVGDFAYGGVGFDSGEDGREEILSGMGAALEFGEGGTDFGGIAFGAKGVQAHDLGAFDLRIDAQRGDLAVFFGDKFIDANNDLFFLLYCALEIVGGALNFGLDKTGFDGFEHAAESVNFGKVVFGASFDFIGERFDGVRATDRIGGVGDAGLGGDDLLSAQSDQSSFFRGEGESFVHGIGVQRLAATQYGGERLDGDAHDIVFRLLRGERRASGLRVEAEEKRARIFGSEAVTHDFGPEAASGAKFGDFFEEIAVGVEEEGKLRREFVDREAGVECGLNVGNTIGEREGDFLDRGGTRFADVITGDGDGVPFGKSIAAPGKNVGDDAHRGAHRIDVGSARDVFLEDIVLNGAGEFGEIGALFSCDGDVEAEKNCGRSVDGHGSGNAFERDLIEERFHVFERIDGYANLADFSESERMIGVHANLRRKIKSNGQTLLSFAEEVAIALIGFGGAAEPGVLAHGPKTSAIHSGINTAGKRKFAGETGRGLRIRR